MSSILKALQKLEKEKSAKEERPVRLAWEVMRPDRSVRNLPVGLILIVFCTLAVGITGTVFWMSRSNEAIQPPAQIETKPHKTSGTTSIINESKTKTPPTSGSASKAPAKKKAVASTSPVDSNPHTESRESISRAGELQLSLLDHKNGTGSVAVINDLPVMEGTSIAGYRVVAILPDKVLLEREGKVFFVAE